MVRVNLLIEAIKLLIGKIWPSKEATVAVAAPTELAAFNTNRHIPTDSVHQESVGIITDKIRPTA